jgi:rhodanese-related sulfurtransferase
MTSVAYSIDEMLVAARRQLTRLSPHEAWAAQREGALIVDIRPKVNRELEGHLAGAIVVDRNVLEWRFDPASPARLPTATYEVEVILFCNEGYASSLAALSLQQLGITRATDIVGGFRAWRAAGLPTT